MHRTSTALDAPDGVLRRRRAALIALAVIVSACTADTTPATLFPPPGEQVEWTIEVSEYAPAPGSVTLKGETPLGFPTETWKDDFMLTRTTGTASFEWNMDVSPEVPTPVYEIDQAGACEDLQGHLEDWAQAVADASGEARRVEAQAFAQHALNTMQAQGCEVDLG